MPPYSVLRDSASTLLPHFIYMVACGEASANGAEDRSNLEARLLVARHVAVTKGLSDQVQTEGVYLMRKVCFQEFGPHQICAAVHLL